MTPEKHHDPPHLSPRQAQIIELLCRDCSTKQIAGELKISISTVKHHLEVLFLKFGVNTRLGLCLSYIEILANRPRSFGQVARVKKRAQSCDHAKRNAA